MPAKKVPPAKAKAKSASSTSAATVDIAAEINKDENEDFIRIPKTIYVAPAPKPIPGQDYTEVVCNVSDLKLAAILDPLTLRAIEELTEIIDDRKQVIEAAELDKTEAEAELSRLLDECQIRSLAWGDHSLVHVFSHNTITDDELLLANGVPSWLIKASKKTTNYRFLKHTNVERARLKRERKKQERLEMAEGVRG